MEYLYIALAIIICLIALVGTISVGKVVNKTDKAQVSKTQQESSVRNVPVLIGIYSVTFVICMIIFLLFMFM